jgi:hypothetical protein
MSPCRASLTPIRLPAPVGNPEAAAGLQDLANELHRLHHVRKETSQPIFSTAHSAYELQTGFYDYTRAILVHPDEAFAANAPLKARLENALRAKLQVSLGEVSCRALVKTLASYFKFANSPAPAVPTAWNKAVDAEENVLWLCHCIRYLPRHVVATLLRISQQNGGAEEREAALRSADLPEPLKDPIPTMLASFAPELRFTGAMTMWLGSPIQPRR